MPNDLQITVGAIVIGLIMIAIIYALFRYKLSWLLLFGTLGISSVIAAFGSMMMFQILPTIGFSFLTYVFWVAYDAVSRTYWPSPTW